MNPAALGCLELIAHAIDHLEKPSDADRRMSVISFDNAIDTAISWYIHSPESTSRLKPDELFKLGHNRPQRTAFVIDALRKRGISVDAADMRHIVRIRNHIYHDGVGICPDLRTLQTAKNVSQLIYEGLFGGDLSSDLLALSESLSSKIPPSIDQPQLRLFAALDELFGLTKLFVDRPSEDDLWLLDEQQLSLEWKRLSALNDGRLDKHLGTIVALQGKRKSLLESGIKIQGRQDAISLHVACTFLSAELRREVRSVYIHDRLPAAAGIAKPEHWESIVLTFAEDQQQDQDDNDFASWGAQLVVDVTLCTPLISFSAGWLKDTKDAFGVRLFLERYGLAENLRRLCSTIVSGRDTLHSPALAITELAELSNFLNVSDAALLQRKLDAQNTLNDAIVRLDDNTRHRLRTLGEEDREYILGNLVDTLVDDPSLCVDGDALLQYIHDEIITVERLLLMQAPEEAIRRLEKELGNSKDDREQSGDDPP